MAKIDSNVGKTYVVLSEPRSQARTRLTEQEIALIAELAEEGLSYGEIARTFERAGRR